MKVTGLHMLSKLPESVRRARPRPPRRVLRTKQAAATAPDVFAAYFFFHNLKSVRPDVFFSFFLFFLLREHFNCKKRKLKYYSCGARLLHLISSQVHTKPICL